MFNCQPGYAGIGNGVYYIDTNGDKKVDTSNPMVTGSSGMTMNVKSILIHDLCMDLCSSPGVSMTKCNAQFCEERMDMKMKIRVPGPQ